jgi:hypothetical protein
MLRQFPAVANQQQMAVVALAGAHPGVHQQATENGVIRAFIIGKLYGVYRGRTRDGVGHVNGKSLVLRAQSAEYGIQLGGRRVSGKLARKDICRNGGERRKEHQWCQSHQQIGDDQPVAHLPQHMVHQPSVEDDQREDQPHRDSDEHRQHAENAGRAGQKAQQDKHQKRRRRPEGAMLRHA